MNFKNWFVLNENIASDFDAYLSNLIKYAKPDEKRYLDAHPQVVAFPPKDIIIQVLKEKNLEDFNWFSFSMGYWSVKRYNKEELETAIDITRKMIDSGDLPKSQIGVKGWFKVGGEAKNKVEEYVAANSGLSNRQDRKLRKSGEILDEDKNLIKLVAVEGDLKLYFLPAMGGTVPSGRSALLHGLPKDENEIKARKRVLCSFGKGTGWCTAEPDGSYDENYLRNNLYIIHEKDTPMYQFVDCSDDEKNHQFHDSGNESVQELDMKYYDFIKKYADEETSCYKIKPRIDASMFLNPSVSDDVKKQISGKTLAEIINNNHGVYKRDTFFKITSTIKRLNIDFEMFNISDFIQEIDSIDVNNPIIKNLIDKNKDKLLSGQVYDLISLASTYSGAKLKVDEMVKVLGEKNLMKLNPSYIVGLIRNSKDGKEMASLLGTGVISKLKSKPDEIVNWIIHSKGIKYTLDIIGKENLSSLLPSEIDTIFTSKYLEAAQYTEKMEHLIRELMDAGKTFNMSSVASILLNTRTGDRDYIENMIKVLGKENVSKLWFDTINRLFDEIFAKKGSRGQKEFAKLLKDYYIHPELSSDKPSDGKMADWARIDNLINKNLD